MSTRFSPRSALVALAFLTRLGPGRLLTAQGLAPAVFWYPLVGLALGALCLIPFWLGLWPDAPLLGAGVYLGLMAYLTRGLHWDGLMDLADALGSARQANAFWAVIKDSHVGAFACIGLFFVAGLQWTAAATLLARGAWQPLLIAPLTGRAACVALLYCTQPWSGSTLAQLVKAGASAGTTLFAVALGCLAAIWALGPLRGVAVLAVVALLLAALRRIARQNSGMNGDFLGAAILLAELFTLLIALA